MTRGQKAFVAAWTFVALAGYLLDRFVITEYTWPDSYIVAFMVSGWALYFVIEWLAGLYDRRRG